MITIAGHLMTENSPSTGPQKRHARRQFEEVIFKMIFGTSSKSMEGKSCLLLEEITQDVICCVVQLMPSSFKREERDEKVSGFFFRMDKLTFVICNDK
jgi:hypothetical protein